MILAIVSLAVRKDSQSYCLDRGILDGLFAFKLHPTKLNGSAAATVFKHYLLCM